MERGLPYVMTASEIAFGMPLGHIGTPVRDRGPRVEPRVALEYAVGEALSRPPCGIAFSGGRDSSLVLAVATHVARRDGFPDPIPLTKVFPDAPETDESEWQELVIRHLGLREWEKVEIRDEVDLIGPLARQHLRNYGVVWPPMTHGKTPLFGALAGGSLLDGEGGDEVLGVETHRIAALYPFIRSRGRRGRRRAIAAVAPRSIRRRREARNGPFDLPWLRPDIRREHVRAVHAQDLSRPLAYGSSVRLHQTVRGWVLAERTRRVLAAPHRVSLASPLIGTEFVNAMARSHRFIGMGSRTDAMRVLAGDLLPVAILERTSKADFGGAYWGRETAEFIAGWTGDGVDPDLVDVEALHRLWSNGPPHAMTAGLLQQAWLATQRGFPGGQHFE